MTAKLRFIFLLTLVLALYTSCKKVVDLVKSPTGLSTKLSQISFHSPADGTYEEGVWDRTMYFNEKGEPSRVVTVNRSTGNSSQAFIYNSKGYLSQWILFFGETPSDLDAEARFNNIFSSHVYGHDSLGNIVSDSKYLQNGLPIVVNQPYSVTTYQYDVYGRMSKSIEVELGTYVTNTVYQYGSDGNLTGYKYNDKYNFRLLSKVLRFICRDYSMGNRICEDPRTEYSSVFEYSEHNKYGFPIKVLGPKLLPDEGSSVIGTTELVYK